MSPTIFRYKKYRFFFFSREESRMHVHVMSADGEAKFWIEPVVALAGNYGLKAMELKKVHKIVEEHQNEIKKAWKKHFGG
ncbi:MAG: hypothetical protein A3G87_01560 [Omnitrophica bacterium RIFCSPLOWO2_12_FULL_50_11]|nr:MAG: hypothetical protein A3G87_01560 [Omnitrophica bacterium RIFCSPLOWO2_12_FULL_50_11]